MRRVLLLICSVIFAAVGAAWAVNLCSITGAVQLPDGSGCAKCTITVNSLVAQTVSSQLINPVIISVVTDASGNLSGFNVAQGLAVQVTISTASGTTGTPFTVIIPFASTVTFSNLAMQNNITGSTTLNNILPPTANVGMNGFTFTGEACPAGNNQPEVESCTIGGTTPAAGIFTTLTSQNITAAASGPFAVKNYNVNGVINPIAYGAVCDGTTNDAVALNAALAACGTSAGTTVELPNASCATANTLLIPSNCTLRGRGPQSGIVETAAFSSGALNFSVIENTHDASSGDSNVTIRDLTITGQANHSIDASSIWLTKITNGDIENVTSINADNNGIAMDSSNHYKVRNNYVNAAYSNGIYLPNYVAGSAHFSVIGNTVDTTTAQDGIFVSLTPVPIGAGSVVNPATDFRIVGNTVKSIGDTGIEVGGVGNLGVQNTQWVVNGNTVITSGTGILIRDSAMGTVTGNTITGTGGASANTGGIGLFSGEGNVNDVSLTANTITGMVNGQGIRIAGSADLAGNYYGVNRLTINGNTITFPGGFSGAVGAGYGIFENFSTSAPQNSNWTLSDNTISGIVANINCLNASGTSTQSLVHAIITGNTCSAVSNTGSAGVDVTYCANCGVLSNQNSGFADGIFGSHNTNLVLGGNIFASDTANYVLTTTTYAAFDVNNSLLTATAGVVNGCKWQVSLSGGVGTTSVACLANFTNVAYSVGLATATAAVATPTAVVGNVFCAQTAANSTTIACTSSAAADGRPVFGVGY